MATITAAHNEIERRVSDYMGFGLSPPVAGSAEETRINDAIRSGLRRFYHSGHPWKFLYPVEILTTSAPYATGTVEVAPASGGSVVTITGGTFAADIDEQWRLRIGGDDYDVLDRLSSTQIRLVDDNLTVAAGTEFELGKPYYDLPADFAGFHGNQMFFYGPGKGELYGPIPIVRLLRLHNFEQDFAWTFKPIEVALRPKPLASPTSSQIWQAEFWPVPDARYRLKYQYVHDPEMLDSTNINHWGGTPYSEAIIAACLAAAEEQINDGSTLKAQQFDATLQRAINHDRNATGPDSLGPWFDRSVDQLGIPTREEVLVDYRQAVPVVEGP